MLPGGSDSLAAAMGSEGGCLQKEQAVCWRGGEDSASASFTNQGIEIEVVVETQEGKLETILSPLLSMAGAGIAAQLCQDRLDVLFEGDRESCGVLGVRGMDSECRLFPVEHWAAAWQRSVRPCWFPGE